MEISERRKFTQFGRGCARSMATSKNKNLKMAEVYTDVMSCSLSDRLSAVNKLRDPIKGQRVAVT